MTKKTRHQASFSIKNKSFRVLWVVIWFFFARMTPPQLHAWRSMILRAFGAKIGRNVRIYPNCKIWNPRNLIVGDGVVIGREVNCYNQGLITIEEDVVISQRSTLCASTHDVQDYLFPLILKPILVKRDAWIAAEAFVGPGVTVGEGAVLGARGVAMRNLADWTFFSGNPASPIKPRQHR